MKRISLLLLFIPFFYNCGTGGNSTDSAILSEGSHQTREAYLALVPYDQFPLTFHVSKDLSEEELSAVHEAKGSWERANSHNFSVFEDDMFLSSNLDYRNIDDYRDGKYGIYLKRVWNLKESGALAVTRTWRREREVNLGNGVREVVELVLEGDILFNLEKYEFTTDPLDTTKHDFNSVLAHEIGHLLGLPHVVGTRDALMYPTLSKEEVLREPQMVDIFNLNRNYSFLFDYSAQLEGVNSSLLSSSAREERLVAVDMYLMPGGECVHYVDGKRTIRHR